MNYFDILLAKKLEDDRDPKVEGLSVTENGRYHEDGVVYDPVIVNVPETPLSKLTVTENGTYTAPTGTGYNEVDVNVPLPSNAYLLKEIENTEIATFTDGSDLPMPKLEVAIEPVQSGSGDPSPTNIRPISGWDEVNVTVADATTDPSVENVYTIDLDGTRYGGKVDLVSGVLTVDRAYVEYDGSNDEAWGNYSSNYKGFPITISDSKIDATNPSTQLMCDKLVVSTVRGPSGGKQIKTYTSTSDNNAIFVSIEDITDKADFLTYLSNNIIEIVYPLATPQTIQLTPTQVKSLVGNNNNVWCNTGKILNLSYLAKEV